ncbi:MAG TPA: hypothetical protein VK645_01845 [Chitinophagaceae bacterium]|nr:hypothetical protein [Chitinophagaceae bacterium]
MKAKRTRAEKYDTKLAINGRFGEVMQAFVISMSADKKVQLRKDKPKKK